VNDEHGHLEGNRVLKGIASALKQCCRSYDYVARMGGDEFVVVLPEVKDTDLEDNVERFRTAVEVAGIEIGYAGLSVSIGAVVFSDPEGNGDADLVLAEADRRMYANKKRRKGPQPVEITRRRPIRRNEKDVHDTEPALAVQARVC
jgi:diguanylate cyclase (GGDEF)-like protein